MILADTRIRNIEGVDFSAASCLHSLLLVVRLLSLQPSQTNFPLLQHVSDVRTLLCFFMQRIANLDNTKHHTNSCVYM